MCSKCEIYYSEVFSTRCHFHYGYLLPAGLSAYIPATPGALATCALVAAAFAAFCLQLGLQELECRLQPQCLHYCCRPLVVCAYPSVRRAVELQRLQELCDISRSHDLMPQHPLLFSKTASCTPSVFPHVFSLFAAYAKLGKGWKRSCRQCVAPVVVAHCPQTLRRQGNCEEQTCIPGLHLHGDVLQVYVNGWPHLVLTSIPGIALNAGDFLFADLGPRLFTRLRRRLWEQAALRLVGMGRASEGG